MDSSSTADAGQTATGEKLGTGTELGRLTLRVSDIESVSAFYERGVGLERIREDEHGRLLGSRGRPVIVLRHEPDLGPPPPGEAGLYHTAILFDEQADLAAALYATATGGGGAFVGSADHLVSQAFYFNDPEGNGVELYWDRPRAEWRWNSGQIAMDSLPLDPNAFIREHSRGEGEPTAPVGAAARLGHVHLKVGDVAAAKDFYVGEVGFDVTTEMWHSALFASAGGYHHHLGMNVWESKGAGRRSDALGLEGFEVLVSGEDLTALGSRLGDGASLDEGTVTALDPWGTKVTFRALPQSASLGT